MPLGDYDSLEDISKESTPRSYDSYAVALNKNIIEDLASVIKTSSSSVFSRAAIRWSAAVRLATTLESDRIRMGLGYDGFGKISGFI